MTHRRATLAPGLRARALGYRFRESLFFLPALIVLAELGRALVVGDLNRRLRAEDWPLPAALRMTPEAAVWFLSGVAGAMITTAGVVFSLNVVSLQLASGQFSPRVLRTFVRDRLSQVVIGTLVATFVYCTLVLRYTREDEQFAPTLPIGVALVLVVATVILIIAHLDHLARSLQVGAQRADDAFQEAFRRAVLGGWLLYVLTGGLDPSKDSRCIAALTSAPSSTDDAET